MQALSVSYLSKLALLDKRDSKSSGGDPRHSTISSPAIILVNRANLTIRSGELPFRVSRGLRSGNCRIVGTRIGTQRSSRWSNHVGRPRMRICEIFIGQMK
jgi:hypothetical protein